MTRELARQPLRQLASHRVASIGWPPDRTSKREPPAVDRMRHRSDYSETQPSPPSRSRRGREQLAPPKGAKGRATPVPPSRGCSVIELYNSRRPHSSLDGRTPIRPASTSRCPKRWRRNRGGKPLGKHPEPDQINRTTSIHDLATDDDAVRFCKRAVPQYGERVEILLDIAHVSARQRRLRLVDERVRSETGHDLG